MNITDQTIAMADLKPGDIVVDVDGQRWSVEFYNPPGHPDNGNHPNGKLSLVAPDDADRTMQIHGGRLPFGWTKEQA